MRRRLTVLAAAAAIASSLAVPARATTATVTATPLRCSVSGAAFANPFTTAGSYGRTALQTYQHRTWAGFAYDGRGDFDIISWHAGQKPAVLDHFRYRGIGAAPWGRTSINIAGVTPSGTIVGAVQKTHTADAQSLFAWAHGKRYRLDVPASWFSVGVVTVTDRGTIIGYGVYGSRSHPRYHVVSWASPTARWKSLATLPAHATAPVGEQHGDVAWGLDNSDRKWVRLASGVVRHLVTGTSETDSTLAVGAGHFLFAGNSSVVRWDLAHVSTSGAIAGRAVVSAGHYRLPWAAGTTGAVVWGLAHWALKTNGHINAALPDGDNAVITSQNGVALTSAKDGLVHFVRCH